MLLGCGVRRSLYVHGRIASDCGKEFMVPHCGKEREGEHKTRATELLFPNGGRERELRINYSANLCFWFAVGRGGRCPDKF